MTETEVFEMVSDGGVTDFARAVEVCRAHGPFCLIGGLAVNCYVSPVYTMDADLVLASSELDGVREALRIEGFSIRDFPYSTNATMPGSQLVLQFTKDPRYQSFLDDARLMPVLGFEIPVASVENVIRGKVWAWSDPQRRLTKRKKDELDLIRIAESFPALRRLLPGEIVS